MDLEVIDIIFTYGKFTALTPSSRNNHKPHCLQKLYEICLYLLYVVGFIASIYINYCVYQVLTTVQIVLGIVCDLNQFCYVFYILIVMMRLRRSRWLRLIKSLAAVKSAPKKIPLKVIFVASQLVYTCLASVGIYGSIEHANLDLAGLNIGEFYQNYAQFFYLVFTSILLILLLSRYEHISETLSQLIKTRSQLHSKQVVEVLKKIKNSVFTLKEGVEFFNDIFGWSILFTIFSCVSRTLIYLDVIIKHSEVLEGQDALLFYYDFCRIVISWFGVLSTIFLCDSILKKCDEILAKAYQLEGMMSSYENEEILVFIDVVQHNHPEFRAARFFSIDRSTLFSVLNSLTTFLLVLIQFKGM
ncbi:putative gustatory receptor 39b [Tenebrio molitor]|uniref:putative gustatory receptor 39b n=1 Tax=Tenebrio molitor TaxID=7067 RepID=UPI003624AB5E